ncbi:unnamed protein product [Rotaria socialis]|uniref:Uncharacterized protein n=1 Tax=Rotaria socialis TaxID=392032 RepID=A0A817N641_9BILA|nr:unnamed protein product [Rotaria socialis]CAF3566424.1 unnamed protein product [Rotaria socialis]CAF4156145.1 unnamed protein product [Rotaria socialis]CAF4491818.1 unnamed protein product [Rotaria socialis]
MKATLGQTQPCHCGGHRGCDSTFPYCTYSSVCHLNFACHYCCTNFCCPPNVGNTTNILLPTLRPPTNPPLSTLSPECYNPDGTSCEWYKDCLEKKYPCQDEQADYAMKCATKYCNKYTENDNRFSETGRDQSSANITCDKIKDEGFASHALFYGVPSLDAPSFCDLTVTDWWRVLQTIHSAFYTEPLQSLKGALDTLDTCISKPIGEIMPVSIMMITFLGPIVVPATVSNMISYVDDIAKDIARIEVWASERLGYFSYSFNTWILKSKAHEQQINMKILIADKNRS